MTVEERTARAVFVRLMYGIRDITTPCLSPIQRGITLDAIKHWRSQAYDAGQPWGLDDFYTYLGLCINCHGRGPESPHACPTSYQKPSGCVYGIAQ